MHAMRAGLVYMCGNKHTTYLAGHTDSLLLERVHIAYSLNPRQQESKTRIQHLLETPKAFDHPCHLLGNDDDSLQVAGRCGGQSSVCTVVVLTELTFFIQPPKAALAIIQPSHQPTPTHTYEATRSLPDSMVYPCARNGSKRFAVRLPGARLGPNGEKSPHVASRDFDY